MNTDNIRNISEAIKNAGSSLRDMRAQRKMLGTGKNACKGVFISVEFEGNGKQDFKMCNDSVSLRLMPSKDMMALALCKACDVMIDEKEREIAALSARLAAIVEGR